MLQYILLTVSFTVVYVGFGAINFYQTKNIDLTAQNLILYNLRLIPIVFLLNLLVTFTFNKGYKTIGEMLPITLIYLAVGVFSNVIVNCIFFKELPNIKQLIAIILVLVALIICNWKK